MKGGKRMSKDIFEKLSKVIMEGNPQNALEVTKAAVEEGVPVKDILLNGLIPGIRSVGIGFEKGELFLPELVTAGKAMHSALEYINPLLAKTEGETSSSVGKVLIGTVRSDIHDIGKNIVVMMLKSSRWEVTDLGIDVSPEQFCTAVKDGDFDIVGMSALLTMTMPSAEETIEALKDAGLKDKIKIMVGGAPVTQEDAEQMGADGYGENAWAAVTTAERLLEELRKERGRA
jgi:5-methyltetrahydrofolate--homocysteine methyltransferase